MSYRRITATTSKTNQCRNLSCQFFRLSFLWLLLFHDVRVACGDAEASKGCIRLSESSSQRKGNLSIICDFMRRLDHRFRHSSLISAPFPSQTLILHEEKNRCAPPQSSPLLHQCRAEIFANSISIFSTTSLSKAIIMRNLSLHRRLFVIECQFLSSPTNRCIDLLQQLFRTNFIILRRIFAIVIVYVSDYRQAKLRIEEEIRRSLNDTIVDLHLAIIVFNVDQRENRFWFRKTIFVRPLKNKCLIENQNRDLIVEHDELDVQLLQRRLLAIDSVDHEIGCDFERTTLAATITKSFACEFLLDASTNKIRPLPSIELNGFQMLAKRYNFKYDLFDAKGDYGSRHESGKNVWWSGMIGRVANRTTDLAFCDLIYTHDRLRVVDFIYPYDIQPISFLTKRPPIHFHKWVFHSVSADIFLALFGSLLIIGMIVTVWKRMANTIANNNSHDDHANHFLMLFSILLQFSCKIDREFGRNTSKSRSTLIASIVIMWSFGSSIIMRWNSGTLHSALTIPTRRRPIDTVGEVHSAAISDTAIVFTSRYMFDMAIGATCCPGTFEYDLGRHISRNPWLAKQRATDFAQRIDTLQRWRHEKWRPLIFIDTRRWLQIYARHITAYETHIANENFAIEALGIAHRKDALYSAHFSIAIIRMMENGLMNKWTRDMLHEHDRMMAIARSTVAAGSENRCANYENENLASTCGYHSGVESKRSPQHQTDKTNKDYGNPKFEMKEFESLIWLYAYGNTMAAIILAIQIVIWFVDKKLFDKKLQAKVCKQKLTGHGVERWQTCRVKRFDLR